MDWWNSGQQFFRQFLVVGSVLVCASLVQAAPLVLEDSVLDRITAGNAEQNDRSGVIVSNSSEAHFYQVSGVILGQDVQVQARGLNLVNSSGSAVVNGVNIWDGQDLESTDLKVAQGNHVEQARQGSAIMSNYSRSTEDRSLHLDTFRSESYESQSQSHHQVNDLHVSNITSIREGVSQVDTSLNVNIGAPDSGLALFEMEANVGQGAAIAGQLDALYDGGSAEFVMTADGSVSAKPELNLGDFFTAGVELTAAAGLTLHTNINLPTLDIELNGAGCGVVLGSCYASGTLTEITEELNDISSLDTSSEHIIWSNQFSDSSIEEYRSPFSLGEAEADYIVVDNSSLILESDETLELSESAQSHARGLNVVNAVGSVVANVVNISRSRQLNYNGELMLTQFNFVLHGH